VIVVDDGSSENMVEQISPVTYPGLNLRIIRQENEGPARARNHGVEKASGTYVAFLGDDTVPGPGWLAAHAEAHKPPEEERPLAVVGHIDWHPTIRQTAFLRYINEHGLQFGFNLIEDPEDLPYTLFYSSNLSLSRELLLTVPFSTAFHTAAWEDTELGLRLKKVCNLRIVYFPEARVAHRHPTNYSSFSRRQYNVGRASTIFYRLHPEVGPMMGLTEQGPAPLPSRILLETMSLLVRLGEPLPLSLPGLWEATLRYRWIQGQQDAWGSE
jgi:GT2 family glycosyltransferase